MFLIISHHLTKFNGHRSRDSADNAAKIFYRTLQEHVIKGFVDFVERSSSLHIPSLPKLLAIDIVLMDKQLL